jgi:hypothetical protein
LKSRRASFALQLRLFFAVVAIQVLVWRVAVRAGFRRWNRFRAAGLDGFERPVMLSLISFKQCSVV